MIKNVLILFSGVNKKRIFLKWVNSLKWHKKFKALKERKFGEKKYGQWGVLAHSGRIFL